MATIQTPDAFTLLDVNYGSSISTIKTNYKAKSRLFHPDKQHGKSDEDKIAASEMMKNLSRAKDVLTNRDQRDAYVNAIQDGLPIKEAYEKAAAVVTSNVMDEQLGRPPSSRFRNNSGTSSASSFNISSVCESWDSPPPIKKTRGTRGRGRGSRGPRRVRGATSSRGGGTSARGTREGRIGKGRGTTNKTPNKTRVGHYPPPPTANKRKTTTLDNEAAGDSPPKRKRNITISVSSTEELPSTSYATKAEPPTNESTKRSNSRKRHINSSSEDGAQLPKKAKKNKRSNPRKRRIVSSSEDEGGPAAKVWKQSKITDMYKPVPRSMTPPAENEDNLPGPSSSAANSRKRRLSYSSDDSEGTKSKIKKLNADLAIREYLIAEKEMNLSEASLDFQLYKDNEARKYKAIIEENERLKAQVKELKKMLKYSKHTMRDVSVQLDVDLGEASFDKSNSE